MRVSIITIIFLSMFFFCVGQDISTARSQGIGANVTVSGIVTNGEELGVIRYIEDNTGGIALYDNSLTSISRGDEITVTGTLVDYNGLLEMQPVTSHSLISSANSVTPQVITPSQIGELTESELIQIDNVIFNNGGSYFTGNSTFDFNSNGESGKIYVKNGNSLVGKLIPMGPVTLIGLSSQYTFNTPANDGYQVIPRDTNDIIQSGNIVFTSAVSQTNITTTSFDLSWSVSKNSSANLHYGTTSSLGTIINNGGNTQNHTISLTGLDPSTFYYVECFSIDGVDTAFSSLGIYSTASLSSGKIRPYFNHSVETSFSNGVDAQNIGGSFADTIASYISKAVNTLDICVYNASDNTIATAINDATARGVQVRYIADDDAANIMLSSLNISNNLQIIYRNPTPAGIMHNKFIIIDAESTQNSWVMGGSTNWSNPTNLVNDYNNIIFIQDKALAKAYTLEFNEMWTGTFGTHKEDNTPHKFIIGGSLVELYFSPSDQTTSKILETINSVDNTLEFGLLAFTRDDLAQSIIDKDLEFGIIARGIIEMENTSGSEYINLTNANVNVRSHQGVTHQLHHKYLIVDANVPSSDPLVLTGSHNWSNNAENNSDENTLIIHNPTIANIYLQEFEKRWSELGTPNETSEKLKINAIFPNPSSDKIHVETELEIFDIQIFSIDGKLIMKTKEKEIYIKEKGSYILKIITNRGSSEHKVIIK